MIKQLLQQAKTLARRYRPGWRLQSEQNQWESRWATPDFAPSWRIQTIPHEVEEVVAQQWFSPGGHLLDIGCGRGECANWLAQKCKPWLRRAPYFDGDQLGIARHGVVGGIVRIARDAQAEHIARRDAVKIGHGDGRGGEDAAGAVGRAVGFNNGGERVRIQVGIAALKLHAPSHIAAGRAGRHPVQAHDEAASEGRAFGHDADEDSVLVGGRVKV